MELDRLMEYPVAARQLTCGAFSVGNGRGRRPKKMGPENSSLASLWRFEFPLLWRHFHNRKLQAPMALLLAGSSIAFSGRAIFQRRERTDSRLSRIGNETRPRQLEMDGDRKALAASVTVEE
jgi:hypothetical protein